MANCSGIEAHLREAGVATLLACLIAGCGDKPGDDEAPTAESAKPVAAAADNIWPNVYSKPDDDGFEQRVEQILSDLSLSQKVGQMIQPEIRSVTPEDVRTHGFGSVLNGGGAFPYNKKQATVAEWVALADEYYDASMNAEGGAQIPIIWGTDAVHGHNNVIGATLFPHNIGLGATRNADLVGKIGAATAREVRATGIDWVFAPTLAVARNDRWGRTYESYSENPEIVRQYAGEVVAGLQGELGSESWLKNERVVATAKHFIGDGGTRDGVDQGDTVLDEVTLRDLHGQGYYSALEAGVQTVMATFNSWNGRKVHGEKYLLTDVLKEQMGFDGFVVSDWNGIGQVAGCTNDNCAQAILAGIDLIMVPEDWAAMKANIISQVDAGEIPMSRIDDAVRRILRVKLRAGLFEAGKPSERVLAADESVIGNPEHRALAQQAVRESLVLLKNAGQLLPLSPASNVVVLGDGADNIGKQAGGWTVSWQGTGNSNSDFPGGSSIWQGIKAHVEAGGGSAELVQNAEFSGDPDVAIVVYGEEPYAEGQGDIASLSYSAQRPQDLNLLKKLKARGVPVVSVFLSGRPMWTNPELNASDAFVAAWLPGSEGTAVADVLFADANGNANHDFTGKLSFSWPAFPDQFEINQDDSAEPLFPYGYGLAFGEQAPVQWPLSEQDIEPAPVGSELPLAIIDGGAAANPWKMFVGDSEGWQVRADGNAASLSQAITVQESDRAKQGDARQLTFDGTGTAQFFVKSEQPSNLASLLDQEASLQFYVRAGDNIDPDVTVRMDCQYPCQGAVSLAPYVGSADESGWSRATIPLECFAQSGTDFTKVDVPFLLATSKETEMTIADVRIVAFANDSTECAR